MSSATPETATPGALASRAAEGDRRWLFGPASDLLFGCGLLYVLVFAAHSVAGPALRGLTPHYLIPALILLISSPHYGATLLRVYEQRHDRRAYAVFSVWTTLALAALFVLCLGRPLLGSIFFTLYLTWSPWHYSGQNYGLSVMFLGRRGIAVDSLTKRWLHASFQLSFLLAAIVMHLEVGSAYSPVEYEGRGVTFLPVGIGRGFGDLVLPVVGAAYLASVVVSLARLRRGAAGWSDLLPTVALMLTQALWFAAPFSVQYWGWTTGLEPLDAQRQLKSYLLMIFLGHAVQYMWVTTYYARAGGSWNGYGRYWLKAVAAGTAIWTLPAVLLGPTGLIGEGAYFGHLALLIATFVNLHHFILDGAIWKLRSSRVAGVLIRSGSDTESDDAPTASWLGPLVWTAAGLGMVAALSGFALKALYAPAAVERGNLVAASRAMTWAGWLGSDEPRVHEVLATHFEASGDRPRALHHARQRAMLEPGGKAYAYLGLLELRAGNEEASRQALESALAEGDGPRDAILAGLGGLAQRRGDEAAALDHLEGSLALRHSDAIAGQLASLYARAEDPALRDPARALELAEGLVQREENPWSLHLLSVAQASAGRDDEALETALRARAAAEDQDNQALLAEIDRTLSALRARRADGAIRTSDRGR